MARRDSRLGPGAEFDLIRAILADADANRSTHPSRSAGAHDDRAEDDVLAGPGDDCAVIAGRRIALSTDVSVEGVHFRRDWLTFEAIGYRAAVTALSDLAAAAARPIGLLAAIAVPAADRDAVARLMAGVGEALATTGGVLLGGDLSSTNGPMSLTITVVGEVGDRTLSRAGARPGDEIWVTGMLGGAAAAVRAWKSAQQPDEQARSAFARPVARIAEARVLAGLGVLHAAIDLSDGLAGDAGHLAAASGVRILLEPALLPVHPSVRRFDDATDLAISGGDDYELLVACPPGGIDAAAFEKRTGTRITRIGRVHEGTPGVYVSGDDGTEREVHARGYVHFGDTGDRTGS
jgi:thiamine-monophosphate kinase